MRSGLLAGTVIPALIAFTVTPVLADNIVLAQAQPQQQQEPEPGPPGQKKPPQTPPGQPPHPPQGQPPHPPQGQPPHPPGAPPAPPPPAPHPPAAAPPAPPPPRPAPPAPAAPPPPPPPAVPHPAPPPPPAIQRPVLPPPQQSAPPPLQHAPAAPPVSPPPQQQPPAAQRPLSPPGAPALRPPELPSGRAAPIPSQPPAAQQTLPPPPIGRAAQPIPSGPATAARPMGALPNVTVQQGNPQDWRNRRLDAVQGERHQFNEGGRVVIQEPGRTIVQENGQAFIRHNEVDRFRADARDVRVERQGNEIITIVDRADGDQIVTVTDDEGRLLRRFRRDRGGAQIMLLDNTRMADRGNYFVALPPPVLQIPPERYIVDAAGASPELIYQTLMAPPVERLDRAYSLDEIRYSPELRARMSRIDVDTINFDTGSWEVTADQIDRLAPIADAINRAIARNPAEMFLIEGHTDAVGSDVDNLSLSDRRAESVALILTQSFQVQPENLATQGYGEQQLKVPTSGPSRENRRVTVRRITPLLGANQR